MGNNFLLIFVIAGLPLAGLFCFVGMIVKASSEEIEREEKALVKHSLTRK